ncbi:membrane protein [Arthrobacter phage Shambre1]|uniref:Membrane protein n=1 Tax=Arthrobacter phage Shambre1 TaxID=2927284 RepID=A0A977PR38_9CAUD|nr:membrane protein [Arthrobacter phage Shambre1]UXE04782.1 membrane protein [Arthrobacter phage Shambre1]
MKPDGQQGPLRPRHVFWLTVNAAVIVAIFVGLLGLASCAGWIR